jgi:hypothetical protein
LFLEPDTCTQTSGTKKRGAIAQEEQVILKNNRRFIEPSKTSIHKTVVGKKMISLSEAIVSYGFL